MNDRIQEERSQQSFPAYGGEVQSQGVPAQTLPVYSPASTDKYGRQGKALELQETVSLTTPSPTPGGHTTVSLQDYGDYEDYLDDQMNQAVKKRDLKFLGRQSTKYSWASF